MLDYRQFRQYIVRDTLKLTPWWSQAAENLLLGTALVESNLIYLAQLGRISNGGLGVYQCEKATYNDVCHYLKQRPELASPILQLCHYDDFPPAEHLIHDLRLATFICRMHYWRVPEALPKLDDAPGLANYHKRFYNSASGKTDTGKSTRLFQFVVDGCFENN